MLQLFLQSKNDSQKRVYMSKAAEKLLQLMLAVAHSERPMRLMELVEETKVDKSTALRLLTTLETQEFVARDSASKEYLVGSALFSVAHLLSGRFNFLQLFRSNLSQLRDASGETVSFHVRVGDERVCIDGAESKQGLRRGLLLGERVPLHYGSAAKTILAFLTADEQDAVFALAERDGLDRLDLESQLRTVREHGYLATVDDRILGVGTISAPVFRRKRVYGSVTVAGPGERWGTGEMEEFSGTLTEAAKNLTRLLSVPGTPTALGQEA